MRICAALINILAAAPQILRGTARLGLKSAVITAVGDEHMGRFIREELVREGGM